MSTPKELLSVIDSFHGAPVSVVGDLILDRYVWGKVDRISPEAPVLVVKVKDEEIRLGGAGNVANNIVSLGGRASIAGVVGDDKAGKELLSLLQELDIDTSGVVIDASRPTTVKTRVIAHAQQVVRVDREETTSLAQPSTEKISALLESQLNKVKSIIVSDYGKGAITEPLFGQIKKMHKRGLLGYKKIPVLIDPKSPNYSYYSNATIIKPNRKEAEEASGIFIKNREDAFLAGKKLLEKWDSEMVLITLGEEGMVLVSAVTPEESALAIDTVAREVYDVSGAGDTVTATFGLALAAGATPRQAALLGNHAAGIVVGEVGTVAVTSEGLREVVARS